MYRPLHLMFDICCIRVACAAFLYINYDPLCTLGLFYFSILCIYLRVHVYQACDSSDYNRIPDFLAVDLMTHAKSQDPVRNVRGGVPALLRYQKMEQNS